MEELLRLGARRLIRVGTCGGIGRGIRTGDLVIASSATPFDGATATYLHGDPYAPTADFGLVRALVDAAAARGVRHHVGQVATVDVFYNPDADYVTQMALAQRPGIRNGDVGAVLPRRSCVGGRRRCSRAGRC